MSTSRRKKEIVDICLKTFMEKGLSTSTRTLCDALDLNSGGIFWYFKTKDDLVIACATEAAVRIERDLIGVALDDIERPERLAYDLHERALEMRPLMKFFVTVCATSKYEDALQPALDQLSARYKHYANEFAKRLCVEPQEVAPYVYIVINTMLSYMLFGRKSFAAPQLAMVYDALVEMLRVRDQKRLAAAEATVPVVTTERKTDNIKITAMLRSDDQDKVKIGVS